MRKLFIYKKKLIIVLILIIITIVTFIILKPRKDNKEIILEENIVYEEKLEEKKEENLEECKVKIDIKGNIKVPGMYTVDCELRVQDIIDMSGGLINDADTSNINLSKKVFDEMVIIIPNKVNNVIKEENVETNNEHTELINDAIIEEEQLATNEIINDTPIDSTISINNGTLEELMTIPGIGKSKAEKIIEYRKTNPFITIEDIKNVSGIGNTIYEKIKDYIKL